MPCLAQLRIEIQCLKSSYPISGFLVNVVDKEEILNESWSHRVLAGMLKFKTVSKWNFNHGSRGLHDLWMDGGLPTSLQEVPSSNYQNLLSHPLL